MNQLELKLTGQQSVGGVIVQIDDQPVSFKRNQFGNMVCNYQTEKNSVNIKIFRLLDVGGVFWFITQLFFFVITIFGLFDIHRRERCLVIDFEADIELKESSALTLQLNVPKDNQPAVTIQTDLAGSEITNVYFVDAKAKKTIKALKLTKLFLALAIVATAVAIVVTSIWG